MPTIKILQKFLTGKLELGEEAGPAGKRELEEETGYSCKSMELINEIYPTTGYCDEVIHLYEAKGLFKVENPLKEMKMNLQTLSLCQQMKPIKKS